MHEGIQSFTTGGAAPPTHERRLLKSGYLSDQERARVLAFERLVPGDSLGIVAQRRPGQFVAELQVRYETRFYWWPLERSPLAWRVILARPALGSLAGVAAVMAADHLQLCELWAQFERAAELCQIDRVHRQRRYIDIVEAILFPVLEGRSEMSIAGRTEEMRREHCEIGRIADQLGRILTTTDCAAILEMFDQPVEPMTLFQRHCRREEAALYPFMDIVFNRAEERELLSLLQTFEI
jgi:uncharacterized protein (DUF2249 family)